MTDFHMNIYPAAIWRQEGDGTSHSSLKAMDL